MLVTYKRTKSSKHISIGKVVGYSAKGLPKIQEVIAQDVLNADDSVSWIEGVNGVPTAVPADRIIKFL